MTFTTKSIFYVLLKLNRSIFFLKIVIWAPCFSFVILNIMNFKTSKSLKKKNYYRQDYSI